MDLTNYVISDKEMEQVFFILSTIQKDVELKNNEAKSILKPLLLNGKKIHGAMINFLKENGEFENLTKKEKNLINNFSGEQFVELSHVLYYQNRYHTESTVDWHQVRSCVSVALGIAGIKTLLTDTVALGAIQTTVGALKIIGKRYLGYVGVALMIWDFYDCMNE